MKPKGGVRILQLAWNNLSKPRQPRRGSNVWSSEPSLTVDSVVYILCFALVLVFAAQTMRVFELGRFIWFCETQFNEMSIHILNT